MVKNQFPPEGYVPTLSALDGVMVYMPAPQIDDYEEEVEFSCPNCGSVQAYNVADGGLSCTSCGYYHPPKGQRIGQEAKTNEFVTEESEKRKTERLKRQMGASLATAMSVANESADVASSALDNADLSTAETNSLTAQSPPVRKKTIGRPPASDDYDWGDERNELECNNCGASVLLNPKSLTHICPFCGSSSVIQHAFDHDKMRPLYLVPFKVDAEPAINSLKQWLGSSWMTPSDLQQRAGLNELTGIYLPYWTFSAITSGDWKAEVGHTKTRRNSKGETETYTEWRWESGSLRLPIRDLLVSGTAKLNQRLLNEVDKFDMDNLVEYDPSYLAGFNAQTYDVDLDTAWTRGRELMRERTKKACHKQASTSKVRNFSMGLDYAEETWRHVLLPVYLMTYRYENDAFSVMINGQTGYITGQRPVEWRKVGISIIASLLPAMITALSALLFFEGEDAQNVLMFAGVFAVIGLLITTWLAFTALNVRKAS